MLSAVLESFGGVEVSAMDVYRDMFKLGEGYIQRSDEAPGRYKANPLVYWKNDDATHGHYRILFEDTFEETLKEAQAADFSLLNGLTYFGRKNVQAHASKMFALIFDLDDVTDQTLRAFLSGSLDGGVYPYPNYIILSGSGLHLYYLFEEPIPLYPNIKLQLKELKYALTDKMWNHYTSKAEKRQHQGINQGFKVIGGHTKPGSPEKKVRAFCMNEHPFSLQGLSEYVPEEFRVDESKLFKESSLTLEEAEQRYPEWFQKVVLNKDKRPKKWDIAGKVNGDNPYALYDWWLRKLKTGASVGHRYFNIMALAIYAIKNDVPFDRLENDAYGLIPFLSSLDPDKPFREVDVESALECYDERYFTFPLKDISKLTAIAIEPNKRNYQKQADHLEEARAIRDIRMKRQGRDWREGNGRPKGSGTAEQKVIEYRLERPEASVTDVAKALNLSRTTVYKWWDSVPELYEFTPAGIQPARPLNSRRHAEPSKSLHALKRSIENSEKM